MIYLNFLHTPSGGGLQNAISFLRTLIEFQKNLEDYCCIVFKNSCLEYICRENNIKYKSSNSGVFGKTLFELSAFRFLKKGDLVFSIFGPPLPFTSGLTINVGGMAISNVFYPEIDFWGYLPLFQRSIKSLKDKYRVFRYKKLDHWIFETELLAEKAIHKFGFPSERVSVVRMAPSMLVSKGNVKQDSKFKFDTHRTQFLMLCGAHPNKRHHLLVSLAKKLRSIGRDDIQFIFTSHQNGYFEKVWEEIVDNRLSDYFLNIGPIEPNRISSLIDSVDYILNISLLESFSNNFVEAWVMEKPLITVDAEWARSAAGDAAVYLELTSDGIDVYNFLAAIARDKKDLVKNGLDMLENYPSSSSKIEMYLEVIQFAKKNGIINKEQSSSILL